MNATKSLYFIQDFFGQLFSGHPVHMTIVCNCKYIHIGAYDNGPTTFHVTRKDDHGADVLYPPKHLNMICIKATKHLRASLSHICKYLSVSTVACK